MNTSRCLCHLIHQSRKASLSLSNKPRRRYASSSNSFDAIGFQEKLVKLAELTIVKAKSTSSTGEGNSSSTTDVEAAKRTKQVESTRDALRAWQKAAELRKSLQDVRDNDPDEDMRELASLDLESADSDLSDACERLENTLLPPDSYSSLGCLLEIKAGVGGSEATIFASDILRMYTRFAAGKKWKTDLVSTSSVSGEGGRDAFREATLEIDGHGAYEALRYEAGVHRVQRVPATEASGRLHSSTVSVIVLPSTSGNDPSLDNVLDEKDVKVEVMRSGGAGGQHVNRTESAVRLTHLPTGITVSMQDTRSQHKNRVKAFQVLRGRLLALKMSEAQASSRAERRAQVKTLDRSEKIRTYQVPQDRITDHRIPLTLSGTQGFLDGDDGNLEAMQVHLSEWMKDRRVDDMLEDVKE